MLSLPDEILTRLLHFLDASSLLSMGMVCVDFSRLVVDHSFRLAVKWQRRRFLDEALVLLSVVLRLDPKHAGRPESGLCHFLFFFFFVFCFFFFRILFCQHLRCLG